MNLLVDLHEYFDKEQEIKHIDNLHNFVGQKHEIERLHFLESLLDLSKKSNED